MFIKIPLVPLLWTLGGLAFLFVPRGTPPFVMALWATVAIVLWGANIYADRLMAWSARKLEEHQRR